MGRELQKTRRLSSASDQHVCKKFAFFPPASPGEEAPNNGSERHVPPLSANPEKYGLSLETGIYRAQIPNQERRIGWLDTLVQVYLHTPSLQHSSNLISSSIPSAHHGHTSQSGLQRPSEFK
ncbi:hypothetical protein CSKR_203163 [Clonorchis sinensis]|uniref:Uncharacterized protein n=1 Tax=Clonorchis sinensis TaxID=79923 RepID=A0A8T1M6T2_CLOSI|nr:hypothetical protein CSKR_203163 [Clonorchis sinensis]